MNNNQLLATKYSIDLLLSLKEMSQEEFQYFKQQNIAIINELIKALEDKGARFDPSNL